MAGICHTHTHTLTPPHTHTPAHTHTHTAFVTRPIPTFKTTVATPSFTTPLCRDKSKKRDDDTYKYNVERTIVKVENIIIVEAHGRLCVGRVPK